MRRTTTSQQRSLERNAGGTCKSSGTRFKIDAFLDAHPFGTVPAAFGPDGSVGIFESNSILRAVAHSGEPTDLYRRDGHEASRIDTFLDASLAFAREAQISQLGIRDMAHELRERMHAAYDFYPDGIEAALQLEPAHQQRRRRSKSWPQPVRFQSAMKFGSLASM